MKADGIPADICAGLWAGELASAASLGAVELRRAVPAEAEALAQLHLDVWDAAIRD